MKAFKKQKNQNRSIKKEETASPGKKIQLGSLKQTKEMHVCIRSEEILRYLNT